MRSAHALEQAPTIGLDPGRPSRRAASLVARVRSPRLDRELAAGVVSWRSPLHAARAVQLTRLRRRLGLARSLVRSGKPVDARGVAQLRRLLGDGGGPVYRRSHPAALSDALQLVSRWLDAVD